MLALNFWNFAKEIAGEFVPYSFLRTCLLILIVSAALGCTAWQPTKEVWKTTKSLWNTYVSPPAEVDYDDKGGVNPEAYALSTALIGIDAELGKLERTMQNADRPPTQEWLQNLFASLPWLNGFAGVKYDGTILGQEPPNSLKQLDFIPLLYEDKKQGSRALRADAQPGPLGPEVMLATPLYDGVDFLGIVVAYFDMRSLMRFSNNANDIVALCPGALLWPGKYDFAATPLAGVKWEKVVLESTSGTCANANGTFYYMVRYLGNMPMVFAIAAEGTFPEGTGALDQGNPYFPQSREKLPPPPMPERRRVSESQGPAFIKPEPEPEPEPAPAVPEPSERNVIQQGSRESLLLKQRQLRQRQIRERQLEGENVPYQPRRQQKPEGPTLDLIPDAKMPTLPGGRPSPFGPREEKKPERPSPFGPPVETAPVDEAPAQPDAQPKEQAAPGAEPDTAPRLADGEKEPAAPEAAREAAQGEAAQKDASGGKAPEAGPRPAAGEKEPGAQPPRPATLPGGRPSPFGPRN